MKRRLSLSLHKHRHGLRWAGAAISVALLAIGLVAALRPAPVPPEPDPIELMQRQLAAVKPVTLIGPRGKPAWHEWILGSPEFVPSPLGDGSCSFEAVDFGLLALCSDPITDRYRLRAELRYLAGRSGSPEVGSCAGLFFGRCSRQGSMGARLLLNRFNDNPVSTTTGVDSI